MVRVICQAQAKTGRVSETIEYEKAGHINVDPTLTLRVLKDGVLKDGTPSAELLAVFAPGYWSMAEIIRSHHDEAATGRDRR